MTGVSIPLPDTWMVEVPVSSSETSVPLISITKDGVSPHLQAMKIATTAEEDDGYGVIVVTRYHKIFDGSIHFSFRIPHDKGM